jgi:hemolysin activation/secretion protein
VEEVESAFLRAVASVCIAAVLLMSASPAGAQTTPADATQRPSSTPSPFFPLPATPLRTPEIDAPKFVAPPARGLEGPRLYVKRIELEGPTVLDAATIAAVTEKYVNREIDSEELEAMRTELTRLYVERGYINSGVIVPDQQIGDGVLRLRAIEGTLTGVELDGEHLRLRSYLTSRLALGAGRVLNLNSLREAISILQQDGLVERINAEVIPGLERGEALLRAHVQEARPYQVGVALNNHVNASVGELRAELFAVHRNLTGAGDRLELRHGETRGVTDYFVGYALPVNAYDTVLSVSSSRLHAGVTESPLQSLNIRSYSETTALGVEHPVYRKGETSIKVGANYERRRSETFILDAPFSFTPGITDGSAFARLWRLNTSWTNRDTRQVLAARLQLTLGNTNAADPKTTPSVPDRAFTVWLGQFQWAHRLPVPGSQIIARLEFQETQDVLLPMERYGLGGANTVRGFRENQLLRDRGQLFSLEYRHPLLGKDYPTGPQIAPFVDYGRSANRDGTDTTPERIAGVGIGLLWTPNKNLNLQFYAARGSRRSTVTGSSLQDRGMHLAFVWTAF